MPARICPQDAVDWLSNSSPLATGPKPPPGGQGRYDPLRREKRLHEEALELWAGAAPPTQVEAALAVLETERAARPGAYWFGGRIGHADVAVAVMLRFLDEVHPGLASLTDLPAL
ncbi:hypothetical protein HB777_01325 [Mesorhizobium loti]|nr:hypothetical protein HB777_01325 [Mesorhizobium loti]